MIKNKTGLALLRRGFSVIPVGADKKPISVWKPYQKRKPSEAEATRWWSNGHRPGVGIVTGEISGLAVIDADTPEAVAWCETYLPKTPSVQTANGRHYYFKYRQGLRNAVNMNGLKLDVRGEGGYVVAPPSVHPSGVVYTWVEGRGLDDLPLAEWPEEALAQNGKNEKPPVKRLFNGVKEGGRNDSVARVAGALFRQGLDKDDVLAQCLAANERYNPPLPEPEVRGVVESIARRHAAQGEQHHLTDAGNAKRFVAQHGDHIRWWHDRGRWVVWNGTRWAEDATGMLITTKALDTVRSIYDEAAMASDADRRQALAKHGARSESKPRLDAMLGLAQRMSAITSDELDRDPWLLNVQNGTIELKTGKLRPHAPGDFITKIVPVDFDPAAKCPQWERFLKRIMGKVGLVKFLQRAIGYALTGDVSEQVFFLLHGTGDNGKSTLLSVLRNLLAGYAAQAEFKTFLASDRDGVRNDLAALRGSRLVAALEMKTTGRLDEGVIKQLTGGDAITVRYLFQEHFTFVPEFKIFLAANHKPRVIDDGHAMWRRVRLIPFTVAVPKEEQDRELGAKLLEELPGILAWAVRGCLAWQRKGLAPSKEVVAATGGYRAEQDVFQQFLDEETTQREGYEVPNSEIYQKYKNWAENNREFVLSHKGFSAKLKDLGFEQVRTGAGGRKWKGLRLVDPWLKKTKY